MGMSCSSKANKADGPTGPACDLPEKAPKQQPYRVGNDFGGMMSPGPNNMQPQFNPMMSPGPMNMSPPQQPMYQPAPPAPAPQQMYHEPAPPVQHVRFEPAAPQAQCATEMRGSPQQRPMEAQTQIVQEMPKVIQAPSAPPCEVGGFREFIVEETRPVHQVMERGAQY